MTGDDDFESSVLRTEPGLRHALTGNLVPGAVADALAEAFAYAWEHRERVMAMENPTGYLFRVAPARAPAGAPGGGEPCLTSNSSCARWPTIVRRRSGPTSRRAWW